MSVEAGAGTPPAASVTITDVARVAGVATSTVSRALSNPDRVSDTMRSHVLSVVSELGYLPNPKARALSSGAGNIVSLLIPDITNPFFFGLFRGTQVQARARGYFQLVANTEESGAAEAAYLAGLAKTVDGVIVAASRLSDAALAAAAREFPIVTINRDIRSVPTVIIDTPSAMRHVIEHLASLGHHDIVYAAGPSTSWSNRRRWRALRTAARSTGVEIVKTGPFPPTLRAGASAADALIRIGATACIAFNDMIAIGMLQRLAERGISVPEEISVVGSDDSFGAAFCSPPLTTLAAPVEHAGRVATDMLLSEISRRAVGGPDAPPAWEREVLTTFLTIRASTGPAPGTTARPPVPRKAAVT